MSFAMLYIIQLKQLKYLSGKKGECRIRNNQLVCKKFKILMLALLCKSKVMVRSDEMDQLNGTLNEYPSFALTPDPSNLFDHY